MIDVLLSERQPLRVLCLGAHSDDLEIGCAGTLLRLAGRRDAVEVDWVVLGAGHPERAAEAKKSASALLGKIAKRCSIAVRGFRDGHFPFQGSAIKDSVEALKQTRPDVIFTHYRGDLHQDHRLVAEVTFQTFREHLILEYEVPKYDGDFGSPNVFAGLKAVELRRKTRHLVRYFPSQRDRSWFTEETFLALARLRGIESRSPGGYAEAFYCRKMIWRP
jgi:LmbE family N-acetylglucosaminyl deacetylase